MKIQLIRNATMKISYAGKTFLTDPMLAGKGEIQSFAGIEKNPTKELPLPEKEILSDIDAVLVSHNHPDHFDPKAVDLLDKNLTTFIQPADEEAVRNFRFNNFIVVEKETLYENIKITRTGGKHGSDEILEKMGEVSGFIFEAENEPVVYWIGDSVLCEEVIDVVKKYSPDIIITHSGGAQIPGFNPILMDADETLKLFELNKEVKVVAVHLESLDHCPVTRDELRKLGEEKNITDDRLIILDNGEIREF